MLDRPGNLSGTKTLASGALDQASWQARSALNGKDSFTDLNGLERIKQQGKSDQRAALKQVAQQFESMFLNMMLKTMRQANNVFAEDNPLNSSELQFHQDMYDHQLALQLSQGQGMGLADTLYQQLLRQYGDQLQPQAENAATANGAAPAAGASAFATPEAFIAQLYPHAQQAAQQLGTQPEVLLAQAALETGWGKKVIQAGDGSSHNLFNIKADSRWTGDHVTVDTLEYRDGVAVREQAPFRRYGSWQESFADYVDFLQRSPRYRDALAQADDPQAFTQALQEAGYATDPAYAEKIQRVLRSDWLQLAANSRGGE